MRQWRKWQECACQYLQLFIRGSLRGYRRGCVFHRFKAGTLRFRSVLCGLPPGRLLPPHGQLHLVLLRYLRGWDHCNLRMRPPCRTKLNRPLGDPTPGVPHLRTPSNHSVITDLYPRCRHRCRTCSWITRNKYRSWWEGGW